MNELILYKYSARRLNNILIDKLCELATVRILLKNDPKLMVETNSIAYQLIEEIEKLRGVNHTPKRILNIKRRKR